MIAPLDLKWKGEEIKGEGEPETMILELGQVSLGFGLFIFSLVASLIFLGFEWCFKLTISDNNSRVKKDKSEMNAELSIVCRQCHGSGFHWK